MQTFSGNDRERARPQWLLSCFLRFDFDFDFFLLLAASGDASRLARLYLEARSNVQIPCEQCVTIGQILWHVQKLYKLGCSIPGPPPFPVRVCIGLVPFAVPAQRPIAPEHKVGCYCWKTIPH